MKTMTCVPVIQRTRFRARLDDYSTERFPKEVILLRFTASLSARSVCMGWGKRPFGLTPRTMSPYVVDKKGNIYEMFPPELWARHLGMQSQNPDSVHDRRTIGIDIVNEGPLRVDRANPDQLNWWPNRFGVRHCGLEETEKYVAGDFRGERYFAAFPHAQMLAVQFLVGRLRKEFGIPAVIPPPAKRSACDPEYFLTYRGIASHQNFRDDRFDIGPAFDWGWLGT